jgi:hypothetical protein
MFHEGNGSTEILSRKKVAVKRTRWKFRTKKHNTGNKKFSHTVRHYGTCQYISLLRRLRQEDCEVKASLSYIPRSCLKKQNKTKLSSPDESIAGYR